MKRTETHERRQSAARMEASLVGVGALSAIASVFGFLSHGWPTGLGLLVLGSLAFGLARLFDLVAGLAAAIDRLERDGKPHGSNRILPSEGSGSATVTQSRNGADEGAPEAENP